MSSRYRWLLLLSASAFLCVLAVVIVGTPARADNPAPQDAFRAALASARADFPYRISALVEQHIMPKPAPQNLGMSGTSVTMHLDGEIATADQARFDWDVATGGEQESANLEVVMVGSEAFIGREGHWTRVQDPLGAAAPAADSLTLLDAATEIEKADRCQHGGRAIPAFRLQD